MLGSPYSTRVRVYGCLQTFFYSVLAFMFFGLEGKSSDVFNFSGKLTVYFWGLNRQNSVLWVNCSIAAGIRKT